MFYKYLLLFLVIFLINADLIAKRTITIGLTSTEIAVKFLSDNNLIACDKWSKGVEGALGAVDLGGIYNLDYKLIKELNPDIIIVDYEFSLFGNKEKLQELGFKLEILSNVYTKEQTIKNIERIAKLVGKPNSHSDVVIDFKTKYTSFELVKSMNILKKSTVYLDMDPDGDVIIAGSGTTPYELLKIAGNKVKLDYTGWNKISKDEIEKLQVEFIIIPYMFIEKLGGNSNAIEFFKNTKSGKEDKIIVLEDWKLKNYGIYSADILLELVGTLNDKNF